MIDRSYTNRLVRLASDRQFSEEPVENLYEHIRHGEPINRNIAIESLGRMQERDAMPFLLAILVDCEQALRTGADLKLPGHEGHALSVGDSILRTLAMLDCEEAHRELVLRCERPGLRWLRASAISATGLETNYYDGSLIRRYLQAGICTTFRLAALDAIFQTRGPRLVGYKPLVLPLLNDPSPSVVVYAVDILVTLMCEDGEIAAALEELLDDHRFCRHAHTTVGRYVANYLS